jgi:hypothetical protein
LRFQVTQPVTNFVTKTMFETATITDKMTVVQTKPVTQFVRVADAQVHRWLTVFRRSPRPT